MKSSHNIIFSTALLLLLVSCGNDKSSSKSSAADVTTRAASETESLDTLGPDSLYNAKFMTLNPQVNGTIPGSATIRRQNDKVFAYIRIFAGAAGAWHPQNIYTGDRCPTMADDENRDGFIDIIEGNKVWGNVLIPLDADIGSQNGGKNFYPLGDMSGSYFYERLTSFKRMINDLQDADKDPHDHIVKMATNEELSLLGKVVVIQGVLTSTNLPDTVAGMGRFKAPQMLPIACGVFQKVTSFPGTSDNGQIPGPVGDVIEGQDRPASPGEGETSGDTGGGSRTGGTNDSETGETPTSSDGGGSGSSTSGSDYGDDDDE